eukprot:2030637-Pyramimonas_sp.AAC.2
MINKCEGLGWLVSRTGDEVRPPARSGRCARRAEALHISGDEERVLARDDCPLLESKLNLYRVARGTASAF